MLKLKLQYFGHLMHKANSLEKFPWCSEILRAGGERGNRGWDGWMASLTPWTWVWENSGKWWRTGKAGVLQSMESQRAEYDLEIEQQKQFVYHTFFFFSLPLSLSLSHTHTRTHPTARFSYSLFLPSDVNSLLRQLQCQASVYLQSSSSYPCKVLTNENYSKHSNQTPPPFKTPSTSLPLSWFLDPQRTSQNRICDNPPNLCWQ